MSSNKKNRELSDSACFIDEYNSDNIKELEDLVPGQNHLYWGLKTAYLYPKFNNDKKWLPERSEQIILEEGLSDKYLYDNYGHTEGIIYDKSQTQCTDSFTLADICEVPDITLKRNKHNKNTNQPLSCPVLPLCPETKEFRKEINLFYTVTDNAFCPDLNSDVALNSECSKCKYRKNGFIEPRRGDTLRISVYDVRLCGHPVRVIFSYKDFRCNRRKQKLRSINGVNNRSK